MGRTKYEYCGALSKTKRFKVKIKAMEQNKMIFLKERQSLKDRNLQEEKLRITTPDNNKGNVMVRNIIILFVRGYL